MCHPLLASASLIELLLRVDQSLAVDTRRRGCRVCGGRLRRGDFEHKSRGTLVAPGRRARIQFSFCCADRDCRKRADLHPQGTA